MSFVKVKCVRYSNGKNYGDSNTSENITALINTDCVKAIVGNEIYFIDSFYDNSKILIGDKYCEDFEFVEFV